MTTQSPKRWSADGKINQLRSLCLITSSSGICANFLRKGIQDWEDMLQITRIGSEIFLF
ncbi:MAG: hypothetical protein ICV78_05965 [Tolypothrix sp. Co-bin9]|nr:hypothetical protein [Tolypothrix sp. Co-bin9]